MPNMYSNPIQGTPTNNYVSQHVDMPLDSLEKALVIRQGQYDATENLGIQEKTRLGGISAIGDWAEKTLAKKEQDLNEFTNGFNGKDLGSAEVSSAFKQKISDLSADSDIQNIQAFSAKYKEYQANQEAMRKSGDYYEENDYQNRKALLNYNKTGDSSGFDSVIDKGVNIHEEAEKYFKALHGDSAEVLQSIADGQGASVYYDNKSGGISGGKIMGQAGRVFHEFQTSVAGKQAMRRYQMEMERSGKEPSNQGAQQYLAKILTNAGAGFQYSDSSSGLSAALNSKQAKADKKKDELSVTPISLGESASANKLPEFDEKGSIKGSGTSLDTLMEELQKGNGPKAAMKAMWNQFTSGTNYKRDEDIRPYMPKLDAMSHANEKIAQQNKSLPANQQRPLYTPQDWLTASAKKVNHAVNAANDKKIQDMYQNMMVEQRGLMGVTAIPQNDTGNRNNTFDSIIREQLKKKPKDVITDKEFKSLDIKVVSVPSSVSGVSRKAVAVNVGGQVFFGNLDDARNPNIAPATEKDRLAHNLFEIQSAQATGGTYEFDGYNPKTGDRVRTRVIPDIMNGTNDFLFYDEKTKKWKK